MTVTVGEVQELAELIVKNIKEEFSLVHLSGNLMDTIKIVENGNGEFEVHIPAEKYDLVLFKNHGVLVYNGRGSYAETVNKQGGFSGTHKQFIQKAVEKSITEWLMLNGKVASYE